MLSKKLLLILIPIIIVLGLLLNSKNCIFCSRSKNITNEKFSVYPVKLDTMIVKNNLRSKGDYLGNYKGILNNQSDFTSFVNTIEGIDNQSDLVYDNNFTYIYFYDYGVNASFTILDKVLEYSDFVEIYLTVFKEDFISSSVNLWKIPRTDKTVKFEVETKQNFGAIP